MPPADTNPLPALTVADALRLPQLAGAQIVAGAGGLGRPISWVHNPGVPDAHNWLNGGELVLTTVITMPQDAAAQVDYIQALADKGVVGLGVAIGHRLHQIPTGWRVVADANDFPLIAVPYEVRFVDVARTINESVAQQSIAMVRQALHINRVISRLVLDGGGLQDLADVLADLIGQSISIETERFEALASTNIKAIDEARRYTLEHGRTNPKLLQALEQRGILQRIADTLRYVELPQIPHVGLEMERILAPVVVHGEIYGYMWIIADGSPLNDIDRMAIESGSTVAALMLLHQEAAQTAEASLKGNLLAQLIEGDGRQTVLTDQALRFGLDLTQPYRMLLLQTPSTNGLRLYRQVDRLAAEQDWPALVGQFAGQVILLLAEDADVGQAAHLLQQRLSHPSLRVGVSAVHSIPDAAPQAHAQCQEALEITQKLGQGAPITPFDQLGYTRTLYRAGPTSLDGNPFAGPLRSLQAETGADLFNTLETYLDLGGNGVATAEALHIHRSTLNYRLQRIEQIIDQSLSRPATRLDLHLTLKQIRLFG